MVEPVGSQPVGSHPILTATAEIAAALKAVRDVNAVFLSTAQKAAVLVEITRLEARLAELKLRVVATASDLAEQTGERDAAGWLTRHTLARFEDARAEVGLATALDRRYGTVAAALRSGHATVAQAQVITRALDNLPEQIPTEVMVEAEDTLVGHCATFTPRELARLGRRIVDVVAPQLADAAAARRLAALEEAAHRRTRLTLRRQGDGTTRIAALVPDVIGTRLATYLEAFTNPRVEDPETDLAGDAPAAAAGDPLARLPYPRRLGQAFCQLLEAVDPGRLPIHSGDATTILITLPLEQLRTELGTAEVLGASHVPGDDDDLLITAAEARRLACTARLIPAVLGGRSEILDLGRTRRLFSSAQRKVFLFRDRSCLAEGCTVPGTWCEAHHFDPWALGGRTDITNGGLLCAHHHHCIHDPRYAVERFANGRVRFHRRR